MQNPFVLFKAVKQEMLLNIQTLYLGREKTKLKKAKQNKKKNPNRAIRVKRKPTSSVTHFYLEKCVSVQRYLFAGRSVIMFVFLHCVVCTL